MKLQSSIVCFFLKPVVLSFIILFVVACNSSDNNVTQMAPPTAAASPLLTMTSVKGFRFDWLDVGDATFYRLMENSDGSSGFNQVGFDIPQGLQTRTHIVPLHLRTNAQYLLQSCNVIGCVDSAAVSVTGALVDSIGYFKASNTGVGDEFGGAVSLSDDGLTMAIGAVGEDSNATGINNDESDNSAFAGGAVYVYNYNGSSWAQQAYIKASNTEEADNFGIAVSLSEDGSTLAVGARGEDGNTFINGDETDNSISGAGAVYVYTRDSSSWSQEAYIKASDIDGSDAFGVALSLSNDGSTLAVGARGESSAAGAAYVYTRSGNNWVEEAYIQGSNTTIPDEFGLAISISGDGSTLAIGSHESSNATGVNGDEADNSALDAGAVYVYTGNGSSWTQQAYIKASNTEEFDHFGIAVSLSEDGSTLAVGARGEDSEAVGINGDQVNNGADGAGAVYVYTRSGNIWNQQSYIKASNTQRFDLFGYAVSLSDDGLTLAVGARGEDNEAVGINGDEENRGTGNSIGAVYLYTFSADVWNQQAYIKASNSETEDRFGYALSLSRDGFTLAVGASDEHSIATGINGDQTDNNGAFSGAVYLY